MIRSLFRFGCAALGLFLWAAPLAASAVPAIPPASADGARLDRVSFFERSGNRGVVVRFHLEGKLGAYSEPRMVEEGLLEIRLYGAVLSRQSDIGLPPSPIRAVDAQAAGSDLLVSFELQSSSVSVQVYRDRDSNDLLMAVGPSGEAPANFSDLRADPSSRRSGATLAQASGDPAAPFSNPHAAERWLVDTIVIDAGHGGKDTGAIGYGGLREKDVVLSVALKLGSYLRDLLGVNVIYTRDDDRFIELHERGSIANEAGAKLFVSIHANSARSRQAYGSETFFLGMHRTESARSVMERENSVIDLEENQAYYDKYDQAGMVRMQLAQSAFMRKSEHLAALVQDQFEKRVDRRNRGVKQAGFVVLYEAAMPSILVELGFVSNAAEASFLRTATGQDYLASAIFRAIRDYKTMMEAELETVTASAPN